MVKTIGTDRNTKLRGEAKNNFKKDFFKLMKMLLLEKEWKM